jgi:hypothetical protein
MTQKIIYIITLIRGYFAKKFDSLGGGVPADGF